MKHYSDAECLAKLLELGFDVPPIVLYSWGSWKAPNRKRANVEQFIKSRQSLPWARCNFALPECLRSFHISIRNRPTAWWTREREEKERAAKI